MSKAWIAVDLDGTLAHYDGWVDELYIGDPILPMVSRVKQWLDQGKDIRIFTARVSGDRNIEKIIKVIENWCVKHIGQKLAVTCKKDFSMIMLYDDRCTQVITNTGKFVGEQNTEIAADLATELIHLRDDKEKMRTRILRKLLSDITLLEDAAAANSRNPPKTHVVADHLDRVIHSMKEEIVKLRADK